MRRYSKPLRYGLFAGLCTLLNLGTQKLVNTLLMLTPVPDILIVYAGMFTGTGVGIITKFTLDRAFVFKYRPTSVSSHVWKFILYALFGALTTGIFWGIELLFHYLWKAQISKYVGGLMGLIIGYTIKYFLDKGFVFR